MGEITADEQILLEKFRKDIDELSGRLKSTEKSDLFLISWIRAREGDLSKAEEMLRKHLDWRESVNLSEINSWSPPDAFLKKFPYAVIPPAHNFPYPLVILPLGSWDVRGAVDSGERENYIKYVDKIIYNTVEEITYEDEFQFVIVVDMKDFALRQCTAPATINTVLETFRRFEANYPERLKIAYVVNAPLIFPLAFQLVKPLLSGRTLNKVQIYNSNTHKWQNVLRTNIPSYRIPTGYGGTNTQFDHIFESNSLTIISTEVLYS